MQTFLPLPSFSATAAVLDSERVTVDGGATVWGVSMSRVVPVSLDGMPAWVRLLDGLQVGELDGKLWAYDFGGLTDGQAEAVQRAWARENGR